MDNLLSVHAAHGRAGRRRRRPAPDLPYIPVLAAFDHEENGSQSDTGADGPLLGSVLERSVFARGGSYEDRARAFAGTVCLSSDTGHAVHPNYAERHDPTHHPRANGGPILKVNVNKRYATDGARPGRLRRRLREGRRARGRPSSPTTRCPAAPRSARSPRPGTASRPSTSASPILSMHSARELCGADDPYLLANALVGVPGGLTPRRARRAAGVRMAAAVPGQPRPGHGHHSTQEAASWASADASS